jgi:peptidoglycan hydrolase-like protein with peptidoglycan-binding domain
MKKIILTIFVTVFLIGPRTASAQFIEVFDPTFLHATDSLAPRDDLGLLHQSSMVNQTDFAPRYTWRPLYWLEGERDLVAKPAYVGAVQRDLKRLGYYCGPINGIFSTEVSEAIARFQKNSSMHVTGTLTVPVRRALHLP